MVQKAEGVDRMKKVIVGAMILAMVSASGVAVAGSFVEDTKVRSWDDLSWWAQSGSTPDPVKDSHRSGYWWWPTEPASNSGDSELWGNRGVVYSMYSPAPPPPPVVTPPVAKQQDPTRTIPVLNNILFDFDKSTLKAEGKTEVNRVIAMLKEHPADSVVIQGHTCNVGAENYNMSLGKRRANAIRSYMTKSGIAGSRVKAVSKGESQPAVSNDTASNRRLNRRGVFKYAIK
jgi:outer membrane protein OmpA-like peptidoglycan-associated protein